MSEDYDFSYVHNLSRVLGGVRIIESIHAVTESSEPKKVHVEQWWSMGRVYHKRIQKKWIKRFGWEMIPCAYRTPQGIICHPSIAAKLRKETKQC